ncbi:MAG: SMC-Scp complex subunit ScpB [Rhodothermaceae bacterium]|nr:SMC-Scp complex subunit ScpB [Rhodothermaceae bacterium]MXZ57048.1 SMC-Scp complex subunit ScpB [Rhodothermaceae bacterium]MYB90782.1 SMC-Scp complex subunit ScpB [Rhodothermaceae bacterium]MYD68661.1 SMC-Scp complex subunit ScpB [Rhodothermaceae bacterium]MYG45250.1 SMC-Scp complex subunit ScpB [Rhodothermaceae bacterium]
MCDNKQKASNAEVTLGMVLEALTFAAETPVSVGQICSVYAEVTASDVLPSEETVEEAVENLNASLEQEGRALRIQYWAGGLRMATTATVAPFLEAFFQREQARRLTRPLMETLAIIAYKQPSTKVEVDTVRGVDSGYAIRKLLSLDLLSIIGRADVPGRPILYTTTDRFLEEFGLSDLDGLPNLRQAEELLGDSNFDQERLNLLIPNGLDDNGQSRTNNSSDDQATT